MRDLIRDHLRATVALLSGFILASAAVLIADAPGWSRILAALLAVVSLSLVVTWLRLPWAEWRAQGAWRLIAAAAPALVAIVVLALGVTLWQDEPSAVLTDPATLILFDASEAMAGKLEGGGSKFEEATRELERHVRDLGTDQLGLAAFGLPSCDSEDSPIEELVSIRHDRAEQIGEKAGELTPQGQPNLVSAARNAIGLLNPFQDERRRLLVITAGLDDCGGDLSELLSEARIKRVAVQWEVVGLGLSADEKEELLGLPDEVRVHFADTSDELGEVFRLVLFEQPIRDELDKLMEYVLSDLRDPVEAARLAVEASPPKPEEAQMNLTIARRRSNEGQERFGEFATEAERAAFAPVKDLLRAQFEILQDVAAIEAEIAEFDESHGLELDEGERQDRAELIERLRALVEAYNRNTDLLSGQVEKTLGRLFAAG